MDEESKALAYRQSQVNKCRAERERELQLRGSESAYQGLLSRTQAVRRDDGNEEEECRRFPEQQV